MSHVIAPEVTIDSTPLLVQLCSDDFSLDALELSLDDLEGAARSIKDACSVSTKAINNAKANILLAYMAEKDCQRWLKKEFASRVDCDNGLLSKMARVAKFSFYTNEKLVVEDIDNNGEETANETITQRTGVPEKMVERIKNKIQKKREEALIVEQQAIEEAMETDKDDSPRAAGDTDTGDAATAAPVVTPDVVEVEAIAEVNAETGEPEVDKTAVLPTIEKVESMTSKIKAEVKEVYQKEIDALKNQLSEKDDEIARLKEMLGTQA